jgi:hypothetical protein
MNSNLPPKKIFGSSYYNIIMLTLASSIDDAVAAMQPTVPAAQKTLGNFFVLTVIWSKI